MKLFRILLPLALLSAHWLKAQEEVATQAYVMDEDSEILISNVTKDSVALSLRKFGTAEEGRIVSEDAELQFQTVGHYSLSEDYEDGNLKKKTKRTAEMIGVPGDSKIEFKGCAATGSNVLNGLYKKVDLSDVLARAKARYEKTDAVLNQNYSKVRSSLSEGRAAELKSLQKEWITHKEYMAKGVERNLEENAPHKLEYWDELNELTATRLEFLKCFEGKDSEPGISGFYRDFYGGTLTLKKSKAGVAFTFEVVRGPTYHIGNVEGVAKLSQDGTKAAWTDEGNPDCKIGIVFGANHDATVTEEKTDEYRGARAYFSGKYFKTSVKKTP